MSVNLENPYELSSAVKIMKQPSTFVKDLLFRKQTDYLEDVIVYNKFQENDYIAKPVPSADTPHHIVGKTQGAAKYAELIQTKEKKPFSVNEYVERKRLSAEANTDTYSSFDNWILDEQKGLLTRFTKFSELIACQAIQGKITLSNELMNVGIDFGLQTDVQKFTATSDTKWNGGTKADIIEDLDKYPSIISDALGVDCDIAIMGRNVRTALKQNEKVMKALDNLNYKAGQLDPFSKVLTPMWILSNGLRIFSYATKYKNEATGVITDMIDPDTIIFTSQAAANELFEWAWGTIYHFNDGTDSIKIQPTSRMFSRIKKNEDLTGAESQLHTKCLPIVKTPEALVVYKCCVS